MTVITPVIAAPKLAGQTFATGHPGHQPNSQQTGDTSFHARIHILPHASDAMPARIFILFWEMTRLFPSVSATRGPARAMRPRRAPREVSGPPGAGCSNDRIT